MTNPFSYANQHPVLTHLPQTRHPASDLNPSLASIHPCPHLTTLSITGADATTFLQGQLTQDMAHPALDRAQFAGYCTAQGRVLATLALLPLTVAPSEPNYLGITTASVAPALIKRLRMFVLRSKVIISDVAGQPANLSPQTPAAPTTVPTPQSPSQPIVGVHTTHLDAFKQCVGHDLPSAPWQAQTHDTGIWISAPSTNTVSHRWWWIAHNAQQGAIDALAAGLIPSLSYDPHAGAAYWQQMDIQAGLPWIEQPTQDLFIAQTLNLDLIGAVSFTKGCYPGQEVVARAHYRGTLKRRMYRGHMDQAWPVALASDIFNANNPNEPCARVISQAVTDQRTDLLMECTLAAAHDNALYLPHAQDPSKRLPITLDELPYGLNLSAT